MTTWTLFGQANPGTVSSGAGNNGTNGLHFNVSQAAVLAGIWHYSPATSTQLPVTIGLYTTQASPATGTLVHSETASWSGAAGSGWVYAAFTSPPQLFPGTEYMAAQFRNDAVNEWFVYYAVTWPAAGGILTAPKDESTSALSQGWYNTGTAMAFPATQLAGDNFGMDVQVVTLPAQPQAGRGRAKAARARLRSSPGSPAVTAAGSPAPFRLPATLKRAHAGIRKSRLAASPGSPVVPEAPSPFTAPQALRRANGIRRKSRLGGSPGSPVTLPASPSLLLAENGGHLLAEDGGRLTGEGVAALPAVVAPSPGFLLAEDGGHLLAEDGGRLATEAVAAFPQAPLDLRCELGLAGTWTDVTPFAYQREGSQAPVTITRGKPDEASSANPATCAWQLNNRDGRFSPRNPLSPYYGKLGRNAPVRWSVPARSAYLRLEAGSQDRAYVNDNANLDISGSLEMRIALRLSDWRGAILACKWDGGGCWRWYLNPDGTVSLDWFDAAVTYHAATSAVPVPYASGDFALRVTLDAASGAVAFYTAPSIDGAYTQLGSPVSPTGGAATSVNVAHGSALAVGYSFNVSPAQLFGRVYEYRLYNGTAASGGTVAADAVFTAQAAGAMSWTDSAGSLWQLAGGAEVSRRDYRFHGEMSSMPPKWDVTGKDMHVPAQAGGPLRRLSQGTANAMSAMKRAIGLLSGALAPVAYWPMEDAAGSSSFGAAAGPYPMTFGRSPAPNLSSDSTFTASAQLPSLNGSPLQGRVAPYAATGTWTVRFLLKVSAPSTAATLLRIVCSPDAACPVVYVNVDASGNLELEGYAPGGAVAFSTGYIAGFSATSGVICSVEATPAGGGSTQYNLVTVVPGASSGTQLPSPPVVSRAAGTVSLVQPDVTGAFTSTVFGHCYVQSAWSSLFSLGLALNAWTGETAGARYVRLAGENGYQARILGSPGQSALMGPQGQATLDVLLKECEQADRGQQFEPRQVLGLGYRTLASMCNQAPLLSLDYSQSHPGGVNGSAGDSGLDPTYDDQLLANDWTLTRGAASGSQGSTWQAQLADGSAMSISPPPDGIGDYAKTATVNVQYDSQLPDVAGWMVHTGAVDDERWPVVPLNLARPETAGLYWDALGLDIGDCIQVVNLPDQVLYDPVKQLASGIKEALGGFHYAQDYSCVPEAPYEVMVLDDPVYGRYDTDGSSLYAAAGASDTSFQVYTPNARQVVWTTDPADFPFDVAVGGERMTVTGITGTGVSTQVFTVTRAVNGVSKAHAAGTDVRLWFAPILSLA